MGSAIRYSVLMFILCGLLYPLFMTGIGQALFPREANGSLICSKDEIQGSYLLGQGFTRPEYFHPRPAVNNYDASNSGGSNLGATSQKLIERIRTDSEIYQKKESSQVIPVDAVTASASNLDPHISLANAFIQAPRIAKARGLTVEQVKALISQAQEKPYFNILGEPAVNVIKLNLALDQGKAKS